MLIQILQELYDGGADFVDISGEMNDDKESPRDMIKLTVKPEYLSDHDESDEVELQQEIEMDYSDNDDDDNKNSNLSEEDLDELI